MYLYVKMEMSDANTPRIMAPQGRTINAATEPTAIPPVMVAFCKCS